MHWTSQNNSLIFSTRGFEHDHDNVESCGHHLKLNVYQYDKYLYLSDFEHYNIITADV